MSFDKYKMPLGLSEGVNIRLPDTEAVFNVVLPANSNEEFMSKMMSVLNMDLDIDIENVSKTKSLKLDIDPSKFNEKRKSLIINECIKSATGLPEGYDNHIDFFRDYKVAEMYVVQESIRLAEIADEQIEEALGNSISTQNGKLSGVEERIATIT